MTLQPFKALDYRVTPTISEMGNSSTEKIEDNHVLIFILCSSVLLAFGLYGIYQNYVIKASIIMLKKDVATLSSLYNKTKTEENEPTDSNS